jgi:hypothetical protein
MTITKNKGITLLYVIGVLAILELLGGILVSQAMNKYKQGGRLRASIVLGQMAEGGLTFAQAAQFRTPTWQGVDRLPLGQGEVRLFVIATPAGPVVQITAAIPTLAQPRWSETRTLPLSK